MPVWKMHALPHLYSAFPEFTDLLAVDYTSSRRKRPCALTLPLPNLLLLLLLPLMGLLLHGLQLLAPVLEPWPPQHTPQRLHVFDQAAARHQQLRPGARRQHPGRAAAKGHGTCCLAVWCVV
jgi:hypothetical protein